MSDQLTDALMAAAQELHDEHGWCFRDDNADSVERCDLRPEDCTEYLRVMRRHLWAVVIEAAKLEEKP